MAPPEARDGIGERIHAAALDLLRARGPRAVTMQAVTEATGIAKTTLYRRHPNRRALLASALKSLTLRASLPAGADTEQRMRWAVEQSVEVITHGIGVGGFAALLTNEDPEFSDAFRTILGAHRAQAIEALGCDGTDGDTVIDMIVGSYVAELARAAQVDENWGERVASILRRLPNR
ncbi:TetR/AcrR family transcriptional regulator [Mycobacterium sp. SMC-4]|uniref:TetR/AcrR family transcriptional regulator n=1 Tax=Mycobacterium sp. SMC-4 TaxID=2857059 RepID=UPI0021B1FB2F|nr:TetR/AcrR family transcriptional regulator [Mycobacterium sp. SMC-4]UXA18351.1 TetR/AcrR family transcriptional regulator [Mycobacterium sp. SMC-4]